MRNFLSLSFLAAFIAISFCSTGQDLPSKQRQFIESQVDSAFHLAIVAAEKLDYDALSAGVDDRLHAGFITNNSYFSSYDSLINILKPRVQGVALQTITLRKEKVTALSENIALVTAYGDSKILTNSGIEVIAKFYWSFVYCRFKNEWKVIQSHQSSQRQ